MWPVLRALLFLLDAEKAHYVTMRLFSWGMRIPPVRWMVRRLCVPTDPVLQVTRFGRTLASPIGLAAGFDKDARWFDDLGSLGFGFVEVGTLTAHAQDGNPKPRLFRLKPDRALLNRFGFNNRGSADAAKRLENREIRTVLGINVGKSKVTPNEDAPADYLVSLERVWPFAAYLVVNVSSPNTKDLRQLQEREALTKLLGALVARNRELAAKHGRPAPPLLVKIAPDLEDSQLDDVVTLALELGLDGIVATNTTISRDGLRTPGVADLGAGGISGAPLTRRSRAVVERLYQKSNGRLLIVGAGGVMGPDDAWELLRAGAGLVQVYTGFIYGGPFFVRHLNREIAARLRARKCSVDDIMGEATRSERPQN